MITTLQIHYQARFMLCMFPFILMPDTAGKAVVARKFLVYVIKCMFMHIDPKSRLWNQILT